MKYTDIQKRELHDNYYDESGFVRTLPNNGTPLKNVDGLYSKWSKATDQIIKDNDFVFDILEIEGKDCIRFNMTQYHGCGCRYILTEIEGIKRLYEFLGDYLKEKGEI